MPEDFLDVPLLAIVDGLDAVDAAVHWFAFGDFAVGRLSVCGGAGFVGAPQMGEVRPGFGADLELLFVEDLAAALGDGVNPVLNGEDASGGGAVGGDADGDKAGIGREKCAEAGAVFVGRAADGGVDCGD